MINSAPWLGYPPSWPGHGVPWVGGPWLGYPRWVPPWLGYPPILTLLGGTLGGCPLAWVPPHPDLVGGTPGGHPPKLGYPPSWPGQGALGGHPLAGVPPSWPGGRYPRQTPPWLGYPSVRPGWGTPHQVWTDWKHYLPHPSDAVGNEMSRLILQQNSMLRNLLSFSVET